MGLQQIGRDDIEMEPGYGWRIDIHQMSASFKISSQEYIYPILTMVERNYNFLEAKEGDPAVDVFAYPRQFFTRSWCSLRNTGCTWRISENWLEDHPITFDGFPDSSARVEVINPEHFVIGSGGKEGSLVTLVNMQTQNVRHFGQSISEYAGYNPRESRKAISSGRIPAGRQNEVLLGSNQSGIFSLQQTTALLEKYSPNGELIWQQSVKIPAIEDLFDRLFEENRRRINRDDFLLEFIYARRMATNEDGVAILLNTLENQPVTVVWVTDDGQDVTVISFPEMDQDLMGLTFTISVDGSYIYFSDALDGELYRAEWPV